MKSKIFLTIILFLFSLVSCVPDKEPLPISAFTQIPTITSNPDTSTPQPTSVITYRSLPTSTPFIRENSSEDCFFNIEFIPEKTHMNEVISSWGYPIENQSFGEDFEIWRFAFIGVPTVSLKNQIVDNVSFFLKNCSLEKIINKLGAPEKIEIVTLISDFGPISSTTTRQLHYLSLGFSFYSSCDETQNCFTFHPIDYVGGKTFYSTEKVIEDWLGFNASGVVYDWHGFNIDVEKVEDKIKEITITDIVTRTPKP